MNRCNQFFGTICGLSLSFGLLAGQAPVAKLNKVFISYEEQGNAQELVNGLESFGATPTASLKKFLMKGESPVAPRVEEIAPNSYLVHIRNDNGAVLKSFSMDFSAMEKDGIVWVNGAELKLPEIKNVEQFQEELVARVNTVSEQSFFDLFLPRAMANSDIAAGTKDLGWQIAIGGIGLASTIWGIMTGRKVAAGVGAGALTWAFLSGVSKHGRVIHERDAAVIGDDHRLGGHHSHAY